MTYLAFDESKREELRKSAKQSSDYLYKKSLEYKLKAIVERSRYEKDLKELEEIGKHSKSATNLPKLIEKERKRMSLNGI
jgi:hypothetical protein